MMIKRQSEVHLTIAVRLALALAMVCLAAMVTSCRQSSAENAPLTPARATPVDLSALEAKAQTGDVNAEAQLGKALSSGEGRLPDYKKAAHWLALAATNGDVNSQATLGELYLAGQGFPRAMRLSPSNG